MSRAGISLPAGDPRSLAKALTALARMPAEAHAEMGLSGRRYVEENFNISKLTAGLEGVLVQVVKDYGSKRLSAVPQK